MVDGFKPGQSAGLIPKEQAEGNDHRVIRNTAAATDMAAIISRYFQALGFAVSSSHGAYRFSGGFTGTSQEKGHR
jgi:hypothetical protein